MSKVFTSNLFFTTKKSLIDKFVKATSFSKVLNSFTEDDRENILVTGNGKNSGLIEFNYSFGRSNSASQQFMSLKILDTNSSFERFFIQSNLADDIESYLSRNTESLGNKVVYFSFGIGDNISNWAGPFTARIFKSSYSVTSGGLKTVTLSFVPVGGKIINNYMNKYRVSIDTFSNPPIDLSLVESTIRVKKANLLSDFQNIIETLVKNYIKKISDNNEVIVVLPKLLIRTIYDSFTEFLPGNIPDFFSQFGLIAYTIDNSTSQSSNPRMPQNSEQQSSNSNNIEYEIKLASDDQKNGYVDYLKPLENLFKKIKELFAQSNLEFLWNIKVENNLKLIKVFKDNNLIDKGINSLIICGDKNLISDIIYSDYAVTEADLKVFKPKLPTETETYNKLKKVSEPIFKILKYSKNMSSFDLDVIDDIKKYSDIVNFRYNLPNSNIISINVESFPILLSRLNSHYKLLNDKRFIPSVVSSIKKVAKNFLTTLRSVLPSLQPIVLTLEEQAELLTKNIKAKIATQNTSVVQVNNSSQVDIDERVIMKELNRMYNQVSIRTVPFFGITELTDVGKKCKITSKNLNIVGNSKINDIGSIIDGEFNIIAFTHVINSRESYSEFSLVRNDLTKSTGGS